VSNQNNRDATSWLLRDAEGDFVVQVRVGGDFLAPGLNDADREAGIILVAGEERESFIRVAGDEEDYLELTTQGGRRTESLDGPPLGEPAYLRVQRRGTEVFFAFSEDGKRWARVARPRRTRLPQKVKVGVVANVRGWGTFKAEFSDFKLVKPEK
jgi:regulation of enolase protein 1 (concanavalin A-like superfamily)